MKKLARAIVIGILNWQVRRLAKRHKFQIVAVAGSVGKTSTKLAIAKMLSRHYKVQYQDGNYNDPVSVPLIFFGEKLAHLFNPFAWLVIFARNEAKLRRKFPYDVVVLELGSDKPGDIAQFGKLPLIDIGVLSGITPEHMQFFSSLDEVAKEETGLFNFSSLVLVNKDNCPAEYLTGRDYLSYSLNSQADYQLTNLSFDNQGCSFDVVAGGKKVFSAQHEAISEPLLYAVLAAVATAKKLGLDDKEIQLGINDFKPAPGRMQVLDGVNDSKIIDDTYNASPEAMKAALKTLYRLSANQKVAILGNMNELGDYSERAHTEIGKLCDPTKLDYVLTIGPDANKYLAAAAESAGCKVQRFDHPETVADWLKPQLKPGALILAKGSQNKVFLEEAVKHLLAREKDASKLVRQSRAWLRQKQKSFS